MSTIELGTIRGRHPLPVQDYLLEAVTPGQSAYNAAFEAALHRARHHHYSTLGEPLDVHLYFTGLTEVTLGALDGFAASRLDLAVVLYRYDQATSTYEPLARRSAAYPSAE